MAYGTLAESSCEFCAFPIYARNTKPLHSHGSSPGLVTEASHVTHFVSIYATLLHIHNQPTSGFLLGPGLDLTWFPWS